MLKEVLEHLAPQKDNWYFDGTLGGGGYTKAILAKGGKVLATDLDLMAINRAKSLENKNLKIYHTSFNNVLECMNTSAIESFDGAVLDLGISTDQVKIGDRGFSFMLDGPLDMRMNQEAELDAKTVVNTFSLEELRDIFRTYGEEPFAHKIARKIVERRMISPIETTLGLSKIIESVIPKFKMNKHPATRVFQALRIFVNQELDLLERALINIPKALKVGGRFVIVTFHSLEDRLVKNAFREQGLESRNQLLAYRKVVDKEEDKVVMRPVFKKFVGPSEEEVRENPAARSAKLRVFERVS